MPKKPLLTLAELRKILRSFGVQEDPSRGKGSHTLFFRRFEDGEVSYPVPTNRREVLECYVKGCRRRFRITVEDGVTDPDFYGRA